MMFNSKMTALFALGGVLFAAQGCGTTVDGDPTPTVTATPPPEEVFVDPSSDVVVSCASDVWSFTVITEGWTEIDPEPLIGIYEEADKGYCADDISKCYYEDGHPIPATDQFVNPYYEVLEVQLDIVADLEDQVDGTSTVFQCAELDLATYNYCT